MQSRDIEILCRSTFKSLYHTLNSLKSKYVEHSSVSNCIAVKKGFPTPLLILEGVSTSMFVGYLIGGGSVYCLLAFDYLLHWIISITYHVFPSPTTLFLDLHFIDLITMERLFCLYGHQSIYWIFIVTLLSGLNHVHRLAVFAKISTIVTVLCLRSSFTLLYYVSWVCSALLFLWSDVLIFEQKQSSVFIHTLFHISLGWTSMMEVDYYVQPDRNYLLTRTSVLIVYLVFPLLKNKEFA